MPTDVPAVRRMRPQRLGHEYLAAWRTEVERPDGVTFVRTAEPNNSFTTRTIVQIGAIFLLVANNVLELTHASADRAVGWTIFQAFGAIGFTVVFFGLARTLVRRRRAEGAGRWPYGLTLWPDRLISFESESAAIVAPRAALDAVDVEDDGSIRVQSTDAYGVTVSTTLGTFAGDTDALRRLVQTWFASTPTPT